MSFLYFLIFAAIWYLPMFLSHRKVAKEPLRYYAAAFFMGALAMLLAAAIQLGCGFLVYRTGIDSSLQSGAIGILYSLAKTLIFTSVCEELLKYFLGSIVVKRVPDLSEAGCMVIMGMVGLGFEFMESFGSADLFSAVIRGLTELHLFFQLWMGKHMWRAWQAKKSGDTAVQKKNMRRVMILPILFHFAYDWMLFEGIAIGTAEGATGDAEVLGGLLVVLSIVSAIVFIVVGMISSWKTLKAEKTAAAGGSNP